MSDRATSAGGLSRSYKEAIAIGIANAVIIGALVHYRGTGLRMTALAVGAVAGGTVIGLLAGSWLEKNGYTMEAMIDE